MNGMTAPKNRIGYVDGLRAVAVLLVVAFHASLLGNPHSIAAQLLVNGRRGVDLFFVLSGFCLSYPTLAKLRENGSATFDVVKYAAHRIVRIVPPYWIALTLLLLLGVESGPLNSTQAFVFLGDPSRINGSFWTLPLEFRWYFVFPVLLLVWVKYPRAFAPIAAASLLSLVVVKVTPDAAFLPEFMLGIIAASLHLSRTRLGRWYWLLLAAALGTALASGRLWTPQDFSPAWFPVTFLVVVGASEIQFLERALSFRWLTAVGTASYSIYLVHQPVLMITSRLGVPLLICAALSVGSGFGFWWVAEAPFASGPLRESLIAALSKAFDCLFQRVGVPKSFVLTGSIGRSVGVDITCSGVAPGDVQAGG